MPFIGNTGLRRNIGKGSVSIVAIQNGATIAGDVQVGISVVVEVANRHTLAVVTFASHAGLFGHIGECAVAIVAIESRAQRMRRLVGVGRAACTKYRSISPSWS